MLLHPRGLRRKQFKASNMPTLTLFVSLTCPTRQNFQLCKRLGSILITDARKLASFLDRMQEYW
jgi:hypothetical protein